MFHVLEHVASPKELCRESWRVLRPGGVLCIETPNVDSRWFRVLGQRWRQLITRARNTVPKTSTVKAAV